MSGVPGQRRRALRFAEVQWSQELTDPRRARGKRLEHRGLLMLLVAAFACGKKSLRRVEELAEDVGARVRKRLGVPQKVSDSTLWRLLAHQSAQGLRQTVAAQVQRLLSQPGLEKVALPLGVLSVDGKSLWTGQQQQVPGLEAVANNGVGTPLWSLGTLRAVLTSVVAAPCVDLEFIGAKQGRAPPSASCCPEWWRPGASTSRW